MKFTINPPYTPVTEMPYCCVPAVLQMILKRRGLQYQSQEEIGYQLGLIVPSGLKHHFSNVRIGSEPKAGYGTQTSKAEFSISQFFFNNNLPLKLTKRQPAHIQELRKYLTDALACGDDVIICYNSRLLFGDGDLEHVSLIQSFDNEADEIMIIDPAIGVPKHRKADLEKLFHFLISHRTGEQKGLWIIGSLRVGERLSRGRFANISSLKKNVISVIIPAHNEQNCIARCLESVRRAEKQVQTHVEIVVVLNRCTDGTRRIAEQYDALTVAEDAKNLSRIRNAGVRQSRGDVVVTIDADSWMTPNMLKEVTTRLACGKYIGGGVLIKPERMSPGIFFSLMTFAPGLIAARAWAGLFWLKRTDFDAVGGFNEQLVSVEDIDFAKRLKRLGKSRGLRFGMIWRAYIVTSCRKFDQFGDWYLFRNRRLVKRILTGRDEEAANLFYYDNLR